MTGELAFHPQSGATRRVLLINGPPASGKTALGEALIPRLNAPLLSLDAVKEPFFDALGPVDRELNRALGRASLDAIWALVSRFPAGSLVMVEAYFGFAPFRGLLDGLARAGVQRAAEIFCSAPASVLVERYRARIADRHTRHPGEEYLPELAELAGRAAPTGLFPVLRVDTGASGGYDLDAAARWVQKLLA